MCLGRTTPQVVHPIRGERENATVQTSRILSGFLRMQWLAGLRGPSQPEVAGHYGPETGPSSPGRVELEGVRRVGVDGDVEALQLPVVRKLNFCPSILAACSILEITVRLIIDLFPTTRSAGRITDQ